MAWTQRATLAGLAGLAALLVFGGRNGASTAGLSPRKSPMAGAVFATAIPVVSGAKLRDVMGGNYYDDLGGPVTFKSQSWFFEVPEPMAKVVEFYKKNLPQGAKRAEAEAGEVAYEWVPPGAAEGELVSITVRAGELQIGETVKAGRGQ